jgi:hypothetical protein
MRPARARRQAATATQPREHGLERPHRRQLLEQRRLEIGELGRILLRQHDVLLRPHAVFRGTL